MILFDIGVELKMASESSYTFISGIGLTRNDSPCPGLLILSILFPIVGVEERDSKLKKSVCASYGLQLLLLVVRNSSDVRMLEKFSKRLNALCEAGK